MYNHTGTFKSQPEQSRLCLVVYKYRATTDYPGAGNSKQNVTGRWEQKNKRKKTRSEEEGRAGEHRDKIYKTGKMLSKDYICVKHSRLVQMSTQPNILADSSQKQMCKEMVCEKSRYKMQILQWLPTHSCFSLALASITKPHFKSIGKSDAQECPKPR